MKYTTKIEWEKEREISIHKNIKVQSGLKKQSISFYAQEILITIERETAIEFAKTILKELEE